MIPRYGMTTGALALKAYVSVNRETSTQAQILLRLYEGAIRFTRQAREAILMKDPATKGKFIVKTMAILDELSMALDHEAAPELCGNLKALYSFMVDQLQIANIRMDPEPLDAVIKNLTTLHDAWSQAARQNGG